MKRAYANRDVSHKRKRPGRRTIPSEVGRGFICPWTVGGCSACGRGAAEDTEVGTAPMEHPRERGLDTGRPMPIVLDGAKALHAAVTRLWGKNAVIRRCQVRTRRSLKAHVSETVVRLGAPGVLRRTQVTTKPIGSALSVTRQVEARVTRWRDGDMRRWCVAGLPRAEGRFRRV